MATSCRRKKHDDDSSKKDHSSKDDDDDDNSNRDKKVTICHLPGNPSAAHTLSISENALSAHQAHGDILGTCPSTQPPEGDHSDNSIYGVNITAGDLIGEGNASKIYTRDGQPLGTFDAFNSQNGVLVTTGDINNDGKAEIIAAEPNGSEIRIFDANGLQIDSFQVEGTIISLAFGNGIIEEEVPDVIDDTSNETPTPEDSSTDESTDDDSTDDSQATDTAKENDKTADKFKGHITNQGLVANVTILPDALFTGGKPGWGWGGLVWIFLQLLCFNQRHCWGTALPYKMVN